MGLEDTAKRAINPLFGSSESVGLEYVMPVLENIFSHAFAIMLGEIRDNLVRGMQESCILLEKNGLNESLSNTNTPDPLNILREIITLLEESKSFLRRNSINCIRAGLQ